MIWAVIAIVALFAVGMVSVVVAAAIGGGRARNAIDEDYERKHEEASAEWED